MKDPKCYANTWFEIDCRKSTCSQSQTPYLRFRVNKTTSGSRCQCNVGFDGNPYIAGGCTALPSIYDSTKRTRATIGVLSSVGSIIFLVGLWWLYKVVRKRMIKKRKEKFFKRNGGLLLQQRMSSGEVNVDKAILFSLNGLEKATDNFNVNRVLGKGGQGTVYKGMLVDGKIVAVKKFKVEGKVEEFINEFLILSQINHRNVVKLLGCCLETKIPLLVYEFIPNGNLYEYLHDQSEELPMTWDMRLRIAAEIAGSLFYLHSAASQPIYIKSTNILLDEKYKAKVADFGASIIISVEATHLTTVVRGTFGYLDPEYFHTSQFTEKSDVYSFGVVLVELLTGKKPIFSVRSREAQNLASYFVECMEENSLFDIIDKRVTDEAEKEDIIAVANLAIRCLELNGKKRPTMKEVTFVLEGIRGKDKKSNVQQNYEDIKEIEVPAIEDDQTLGWIFYIKFCHFYVIYIDVAGGTISIMNPVYHWNCQGSKNNKKPVGINLGGSPFVYSQDSNKFVAVGCNSIALLQSNGSAVGGCMSICDGNDEQLDDLNHRYGCHGKYCCETSLPLYLSEYNVTLQNMRNDTSVSPQYCSYAAILRTHRTYDYPYQYRYDYDYYTPRYVANKLKDEDYVDAVLEWEILNEMLINSTLLKLPPDHANCYDSNVTALPQNRSSSGRRCQCDNGSSYDNNPYVSGGCSEMPYSPSESNHDEVIRTIVKWTIIGVSTILGSISFLLGVWWLYKKVWLRMIEKRKEKFFKRNGGLMLQQRMSSGEANVDKGILFSLKDIEKATDSFNKNRILGKGGQGTVYKGMLVDGKIVAVKKFKVQGDVDEFINEFVILSQINHRNVVKLLGCCLETKIPLLVYEFIPNGNLYEYLHDENEELPMTWDMRLRIATEIAGALFYLHSAASQPIYHRDIKSTNILLDDKYRAKIADFGASRIISNIEVTHLTTAVQGTFGYLDPEYFHTSQFTEKSDVYSFGVVLVELLTGKKPLSPALSKETQNLASYFVQCMEGNTLFDIVDKRVTKEGQKDHIIAIANLANRCLVLNRKNRPSMKEVTLELEGIRQKDKHSNSLQNQEEIEVEQVKDCQPWPEYSTSNSLPNLTSETLSADSEVMQIHTL